MKVKSRMQARHHASAIEEYEAYINAMYKEYGIEESDYGFDELLTWDEKIWVIEDREEEIIDSLKPVRPRRKTVAYEGPIKTGRMASALRHSSIPWESEYLPIWIDGRVYECYTEARHEMRENEHYWIKCRINEDANTVAYIKIF